MIEASQEGCKAGKRVGLVPQKSQENNSPVAVLNDELAGKDDELAKKAGELAVETRDISPLVDYGKCL